MQIKVCNKKYLCSQLGLIFFDQCFYYDPDPYDLIRIQIHPYF